MRLLIVIFACGRDAGMLQPCETMMRKVYPDAKIVVAVDTLDPVDWDGDTVPSNWGRDGLVKAVPEALVDAAGQWPCDAIMKADCDIAHISADWLEPLSRGYQAVGHQNYPSAPWAFDGLAYVLTKDLLYKSHAWACDNCRASKYDSITASLRAHKFAPNKVWVWPMAPLDGGTRADWNKDGCRDIRMYRELYQVVHVGERSIPRDEVADLMRQFAELA